jgi:hypothetical protein
MEIAGVLGSIQTPERRTMAEKAKTKRGSYRTTMWAVMCDGEPNRVLPDIEVAEAHYGLLSQNGFSERKWEIKRVEVRFPHETAAERRKRLSRSVQAVVELNRKLYAHKR